MVSRGELRKRDILSFMDSVILLFSQDGFRCLAADIKASQVSFGLLTPEKFRSSASGSNRIGSQTLFDLRQPLDLNTIEPNIPE
jgi:hypothetical protein